VIVTKRLILVCALAAVTLPACRLLAQSAEDPTIYVLGESLTGGLPYGDWLAQQHAGDYERGYGEGYSSGYDAGLIIGGARGTLEGTTNGKAAGYKVGWDAAYQPAYDAAYEAKLPVGKAAGWDKGLSDGYDKGNAWYTATYGSVINASGNFSGNFTFSNNNPYGGSGWSGSSGATLTVSGVVTDWAAYYYGNGFTDGLSKGKEVGDTAGYEAAYPTAYTAGYDIGFANGTTEGERKGTDEGGVAGYDSGWKLGYNPGYEQGFEKGALAAQERWNSTSTFTTPGWSVSNIELSTPILAMPLGLSLWSFVEAGTFAWDPSSSIDELGVPEPGMISTLLLAMIAIGAGSRSRRM
jgi:hypothetical protein